MIYKIFFFLFLTMFTLHLSAQEKTKTEFSRRPQPDSKIQNLKIGDQVPDIWIQKIIRDTKTSTKILDFKNQLLILDFWDTFCGSCIEALPKLDNLQKQFGNKIKILPVSYQAEEVMVAFFKNNKIAKNVSLPCVVEDKILGSYFQYKLISHVVWINQGKVTAITGTDYVTAKNIQTILDGKKVNWPIKNDMVNFDYRNPIFIQTEADQYNTAGRFLKYSGITGHREGIDYRKGLFTDTLANGYRTAFYNKSIVSSFIMINYAIKPTDFIPHPDRLVLEVKDRSKYVYSSDYGFSSDWRRQNEICYEFFCTKKMTEKERLAYIYSDLNHLLGVNARYEKRPVKCLVLTKTKEIINLDSINKDRKTGTRIAMSSIPLFFLDQTGKFPPAIDETGFKGIVKIFPFKTIEELRGQLQLYGCDIIESERKIDVLVITETN